MTDSLSRATLLMQHSRYPEAEAEARRALSENPEDGLALAILGLCLSQQKKSREALLAVRMAIPKDPDNPFLHYAHGQILLDQDRLKEALESADTALRLDPEDPDHFALRAAVLTSMKRWGDALKSAERGLALDSEDEACANLRALCLTQLGRPDRAGEVLDRALSRNPQNAATHASKGWALLHAGQYSDAEMHFRESLRLDPELEHARLGILESLRSRHLIYRPILRYFLAMSRLTNKSQWLVIVGLYLGMKGLKTLARANPELAPYVLPVFILYLAFVFMSWAAVPLMNLLLLVHPLGKYALSPQERRASALVGLSLAAGLVCLGLGIPGGDKSLIMLGVLGVAMVIPMSGSLMAEPGGGRGLLILYMVGLWAAGICAVFLDGPGRTAGIAVFAIGFFLFSWIANAVYSRS